MIQKLKNKIGNYSADHPLAIYRCKQIADHIKFIVDYENIHGVKLDRERGDLKHFFWAFTCDSPKKTGYDAVKYCEKHHRHSRLARQVIIEANTKSRRKIKGLRHEHVVPLKLIRDLLFSDYRVCQGDWQAVSEILQQNLHSAVITREEALYIDKTYRTTMPSNWLPGNDPYVRYTELGINLLEPAVK